jgi:hypothetical protein
VVAIATALGTRESTRAAPGVSMLWIGLAGVIRPLAVATLCLLLACGGHQPGNPACTIAQFDAVAQKVSATGVELSFAEA